MGNGYVIECKCSPLIKLALESSDDVVTIKYGKFCLDKMESYLLKEQLTDVVLIAGKRQIPAHRLVLSAASDYFAAMFTSDLKEVSQHKVEMYDVDGDALWALVRYCYTGKIDLSKDTVEAILVTAGLLQLTRVVEICCKFLLEHLDPSNCIGIRFFADSQSCHELLTNCQDYVAENFVEVVKHQEFLMLSADELAKMLASDDLNVSSEETVFNALMSWIEHDLPNRTEHISRLLSLIRLPLLSPSFIVDHIEAKPLFRDNLECQELILEAFKYHLLPNRRSMLQSSRTYPRKRIGGDLYVFGGMGSDNDPVCNEIYNVWKNCCTDLSEMNSRRLQCGVAVIESNLFLVGGRDNLKTLNTIDCYNIKTKEQIKVPPMSTPRHGLGVAVLEGQLYAVGGYDGWTFVNTVERWDPQMMSWSYVTPMSTARSTVGVAELNGKLYAVGGRDGSSCLRSVECYDPHTKKWVNCAPMAKRRGGVGVGVLNGFLYAFGGLEAPGQSTDRFSCVERYDPKTDSWTTIASMSSGRDGVGVCALGKKLFAVGGYNGKVYLDVVEAYDPQEDQWEKMTCLGHSRAGAGLVVIRNPEELP